MKRTVSILTAALFVSALAMPAFAQSPAAEPTDALVGVYAQPPAVQPLWYRAGVRSAVEKHERAAGWGTYNG